MAGSAADLKLLMLHADSTTRTASQISKSTNPRYSPLFPPSRGLVLSRLRDTPLDPRPRCTLHDHPAAEPTHIHVHKHDVACSARSKRRVLPRRRAVLMRDGSGDSCTACLDEPYRGGGERGEDERGGEREARARCGGC